ncbi:MAG TPA: ATP-binding protein [Opitutaceae bacterium]|nr:ATP-binding protein [Opitutaceae bacterium]
MEQILARTMEQAVSAAAVQEKQLLLSRLLARLAHELRNPISSLAIHVQLVEEDVARSAPQMAERSAGHFEIIRGELQRLDNLVKQFLSLAGPSAVNLQPVAVARVAGHVCNLLRPEAAAHEIELGLDVPAGLPLFAADPVQLTQALVNLVLNAIQAIGRRGRIAVSARTDAAADTIAIEVRDTGPGIPPEKQQAIFEPFFTTKDQGSGLGLWIVQQIMLGHGGVVSVANGPGGGAVFTLQLPLRAAERVRG